MTRSELEARRLAAVPDLQSSMPLEAIAEKWDVSRMTAFRWRHTLQDGRSLRGTVAPGRPRRLTAENEQKLKRLWNLGPLAVLGIFTTKWTQARFAEAVGRYTGVWYSEDHVGRIMHRLGLTVLRPHANKSERRAGGPVCT